MSSLLNNKYQEILTANSYLNSDVQFLLKKFQKTNETTLIKSLEELKEKISTETFIPTKKEQQAFSLHFANIFTSLATHKQSNVRLNLFICLSEGLLECQQGKNVINFCVGDIISWWLLCSNDTVKDVGNAAQKALMKISEEGRGKVITANISKILRLVSNEEYDVISRMGCLGTVLPNINVDLLSQFGYTHLQNAIKSLIDSYGTIPDEIYFSTIDAALVKCSSFVMKSVGQIKNVIVKTIRDLQPFSKHSKQVILCLVSLIELHVQFDKGVCESLIEYVSNACLGSLHVFPILKKLLPFVQQMKKQNEYVKAVTKAIGSKFIGGPQRAIVILHFFESIKFFDMKATEELIEIMKMLLNDSGSVKEESGYSSMGIFLNKLNERDEIQGVLSSAVTYLRRSEEKEYLIHLNSLKFIVERSIKNDLTHGFSYDLLKTIIDRNTDDHFFNNKEMDLMTYILQLYPGNEEVYEMIVRQFQHIFMLTVEENVNDLDIINDVIEIDDDYLEYVLQCEDLLLQSITREESSNISNLLNKMFFSLFPKHYGINHLNYLLHFIQKLKKSEVMRTIVLPIMPLIENLLKTFKTSKEVIQTIISLNPPLLTTEQFVTLLQTESIDHLQVVLSEEIIDWLSNKQIDCKPILNHVMKVCTTQALFTPTHKALRSTLLQLFVKYVESIGIEQIHQMIKTLLPKANGNTFILSIAEKLPTLRPLFIEDMKELLPLNTFIDSLPLYAKSIKSPLLIPTPQLPECSMPSFNNSLVLLIKLYHLHEGEIEDKLYLDYYSILAYQNLCYGIANEIPHKNQLETITYFLNKKDIEQYIVFHLIEELKTWMNSSEQAVDFIAHTFDESTDYSVRFFFSTYLSPLHIDWLEKKVNIRMKTFFSKDPTVKETHEQTIEKLKELTVIYPLIYFPRHLSIVLNYILSIELSEEIELPYLHLLYYIFNSSCSMTYDVLDEESLSLIYQFILNVLQSETNTNVIKRGALLIARILITHSFPTKLKTVETEGLELSFKLSLIEFIINSLINKSNIKLVSELLLQTDLLSEIDSLSSIMSKNITQIMKLMKSKENIISRICCGYLIGTSIEFKTDESYIDFEEAEQQKYHPLTPELEEYLDKSIQSFSKMTLNNKISFVLFILGMLRRIKDTPNESRPWVVAYLQLHGFETFISDLYATLPDQQSPITLDNVLSTIQSIISDEEEMTIDTEYEILNELSTYCMFIIVQTLPNVVRQWCLSLKRNAPKMVKKYFAKNICPFILQEEVQKILSWRETEDFVLKMQLDGKAVTVIYKNDELVFESQLVFPTTYPLDLINVVVASNKVGVSEAKSHLYKRMLTMNLMTRDLGIIDACLLWKQQLDKQFDNSDVCPICYSLFYLRTTTIPNVACKCCRKKFHKQCIFSWFKSTARDDCPLCTKNFYGEGEHK